MKIMPAGSLSTLQKKDLAAVLTKNHQVLTRFLEDNDHSPIIKKRDGPLRMCSDCEQLESMTRTNACPPLRTGSSQDRMEGHHDFKALMCFHSSGMLSWQRSTWHGQALSCFWQLQMDWKASQPGHCLQHSSENHAQHQACSYNHVVMWSISKPH